MANRALITGISGQDGSYLAELLLSKGYEVHGIVRSVAIEDPEHKLWRIKNILNKLTLHYVRLENFSDLSGVIKRVRPDECYHLGGPSFLSSLVQDEISTLNINVNSTYFLLSILKDVVPKCKFYFACSSEIFGNPETFPQNEDTPFSPLNVYGISKVAGYELTKHFRESQGLYSLSGVLFNHESPRRSLEFVTRKITNTACKIKLGLANELRLGNMEVKRDWGYAPDYVQAMWLMLQQDKAEDYVIATGKNYSVKEFVESAFSYAGLDWNKYVIVDESLYRPQEIHNKLGDYSKAKNKLSWKPRVGFQELIKEMVDADLAILSSKVSIP